jgi:SAM-dependent methyltransferase
VADDVKAAVQRQFGANADKYVRSPTHAAGADLELLVPWLQPARDWVVLDVATGGGHAAKAVAPHVACVVATDLTAPMLAAARRHLQDAGCRNVVYVRADAEDLPFPDAAFDAVTCRLAAHHFPQPRRFLAEAARVLRPGGCLLLIDNVAPDDPELAAFLNAVEHLRDPSHVRCATVAEWRAWLAECGLAERRARAGRKRHGFAEWVGRTAETPQQAAAVAERLRSASERARAHFAITLTATGEVEAWTADDWAVLAERSPT